jgi:hypothetical protein
MELRQQFIFLISNFHNVHRQRFSLLADVEPLVTHYTGRAEQSGLAQTQDSAVNLLTHIFNSSKVNVLPGEKNVFVAWLATRIG